MMSESSKVSARPEPGRHVFTIRLLIGVGIAVVVLAGVGLLTNAVLQMRENARRQMSRGHLKMLGLALHNYHDTSNVFPPGGTYDAIGTPHHSWTTSIRPYLDASPFYNRLDLQLPWNSTTSKGSTISSNNDLFQSDWATTFTSQSLTPVRDPSGFLLSHYAANDRIFFPNSSTRFADLVEGASNQCLMGEAHGNFWRVAEPGNWRDLTLGLGNTPQGFGYPLDNRTLLVLTDGSVEFLSNDIDAKVLESLAGRRKREATNE